MIINESLIWILVFYLKSSLDSILDSLSNENPSVYSDFMDET